MDDIIKKIDLLISHYSNNDFQLKLITNKLNSLLKEFKTSQEKITQLEQNILLLQNKIEKTKTEIVYKNDVEKNIIIKEEPKQEPKEEVKPKNKPKEIKNPESITERLQNLLDSSSEQQDDFLQYEAEPEETQPKIKYTVSQKLTTTDNKPLFLALVNFFKDGKLVATCKTKANGIYETRVPPGKYIVKISKNTEKGEIKAAQEVTINENTRLPQAILK
jgi:hypothetical protein